MKRFFLFIYCISFFCPRSDAFSIPDHQKQYAGKCVQAIIDCQYAAAFAATDSVMAADSCDPLAPLLHCAAIGIRDVDFDTTLDTAGFFKMYRIAENRIAVYETTNGPSSYSKMLAGFCKGIHSAFYLQGKSYFAALQNGFKSLDLLDESTMLDTTNVEPFFLLGLYEYAKGELKRRLWWILFWYPGSKKDGIARLWSSAEKGFLTADASLFALVDIYARENKPEYCAPIVERIEQNFPKSRFTLWAKAKYLTSRRLFYEAGLAYELLSESYAVEPAGKHNALVTRNLQAHMLLQSGQKKDAADSCRAILLEPVSQRNRSILDDTRKLLKHINED